MNEKNLKNLLLFKKLTGSGLLLGFIIFITSFFVSGTISEYILSIGLSVAFSSMLLFGFGLFIHLMEEMNNGSKGIR